MLPRTALYSCLTQLLVGRDKKSPIVQQNQQAKDYAKVR